MTYQLPEGTPANVAMGYNQSVLALSQANDTANNSVAKYKKEVTVRKYIAYTLRFITLVSTVLITANLIPYQLAIAVAIIYAIDTTLSNSRRLVSVAQAWKAFEAVGFKIARTHQTEQAKIFASVTDQVETAKQLTALNIKLTEDSHEAFTTIETAVNKSDVATLQALSLDEDKLKIAMQHIKP